VSAVAELPAAGAGALLPQKLAVRVAARTEEALGIAVFDLVAADGAPLPAFEAGAHIDVRVAPGIVRQYSLCNAPWERHRYQIGVLRTPDSRGGSAGLHERLRVGDPLCISAPRNHFPLVPQARNSLLLAGGIGVTPLISMAEQLAALGAPFELHYCTRSLARTAFRNRVRDSAYASQVRFHIGDGAVGSGLDLSACLARPEAGKHLYVCGPEGFMQAVLATARVQGWPDALVHTEFFSSANAAPKAGDEPFEVRLARTGRVVTVAADRSVAQALAEAGVEVLTSCEQGVCGTCLTRVLDGIPDHRDSYLSAGEQAANDQFTPCCSRSWSPVLVLDL
jgi:vanillate O-demethylase ferredoxin subunit